MPGKKVSPHLPKSECGQKYQEFKIGDLFDVISNPQLNKDSFIFLENEKYPYFTRTSRNNGILGYVKYLDEEHKISGNCIAVGLLDMKFFYMEKDFYAGQFTKSIRAKFKRFNKKIALFFSTCFNKNQQIYKSVLVRDFKKIFLETKINLPIKKKNEIDYMVIEKIINGIEKNKIQEIDKFLKNNNLDNYELTKEEQQTLNKFKNNEITYKDFKIGDLFDIHPTKAYKFTNSILFKTKGNTPVVVNSSINNGIGGYTNLNATEKGNIITFSDTTTADSIFYQPKDFIGYSHVQGLYSKTDIKWNEKSLLYFLTLFKKQSKNKSFDYATKFSRFIAMDMIVKIPIKNDEIDCNFMENFIKAQQKLAIKPVVDFKNRMISTTKTL